MRNGRGLSALLERAEQLGRRFGPLLTLPELEPGDRLYLQAFQDLSRARTYNAGGPNPITFSDLEAYRQLVGLSDDPAFKRALMSHVVAMDSCFLEYAADKRSAEAKRPSAPKR